MTGDRPNRSVLEAELAARIERHGPVPFDDLVELALYHPTEGFYCSRGAAGRRGDFLTSPEVGPLFGAVLANALDEWWGGLGRPDPFVVVEAGAGVGTLARTVLAAAPRCADALTYVLVERSARLRARQGDHIELSTPGLAFAPLGPDDEPRVAGRRLGGGGPRFVSLAELPAITFVGVVVANELLDNLAFGLLERCEGGWREVRVGIGADGVQLVEVLVDAPEALAGLAVRLAPDATVGSRIPIQTAAGEWLCAVMSLIERGRLVAIDYSSSTAGLAGRPASQWLRTYRGHERGGSPLESLGSQDITCEVATDQLARHRAPILDRPQADFLRSHGIDELVAEGRRTWHERAHIGDLAALVGRSRVGEAEALTDPAGLGAFRVLEWKVG